MKTKPSLRILVIALAVIGFVVVSANEGTSAQPYVGEQFYGGRYCQTSMSTQLPTGESRGARWGRGAGRANWMSSSVERIAQSRGCGDCDNGGQGTGVPGLSAKGCTQQGLAQNTACSSQGACGSISSCSSGQARGQQCQAGGRWQSRIKNTGCQSGGCCSAAPSCDAGRGRGKGWARGRSISCGRNAGRGAGRSCGGC